jgi:hypothetical protein
MSNAHAGAPKMSTHGRRRDFDAVVCSSDYSVSLGRSVMAESGTDRRDQEKHHRGHQNPSHDLLEALLSRQQGGLVCEIGPGVDSLNHLHQIGFEH